MTSKKKYLLIGASILSVFALSGGLFVFAGFNKPPIQASTKEEVLSETAERKIVLEIISQPVFIQTPGEKAFEQAKHEMEVPVGSTIRTGENARAQILFSDRAISRLDENTEVRLEEADLETEEFHLFIEAGRIWNRLQKLLGTGGFTTETGNMTATVRGTSYEHSADDETWDTIRVNTGIVKAECKSTEWSEEMSELTKVIADCVNKLGLDWENWESIDQIDEWIDWNRDRDVIWMKRFKIENQEVLGTSSAQLLSSTPSVIITQKPSLTPSPQLERTTSNTSTSSNTPSSTPKPQVPTHTPVPPSATPEPTLPPEPETPKYPAQIREASITQVLRALLIVQVTGSGFQKGDYLQLKDPQGSFMSVDPYAIDLAPESGVGGSLLFPKLCGPYEVTVMRNGVAVTEPYKGLSITVCLQ